MFNSSPQPTVTQFRLPVICRFHAPLQVAYIHDVAFYDCVWSIWQSRFKHRSWLKQEPRKPSNVTLQWYCLAHQTMNYWWESMLADDSSLKGCDDWSLHGGKTCLNKYRPHACLLGKSCLLVRPIQAFRKHLTLHIVANKFFKKAKKILWKNYPLSFFRYCFRCSSCFVFDVTGASRFMKSKLRVLNDLRDQNI